MSNIDCTAGSEEVNKDGEGIRQETPPVGVEKGLQYETLELNPAGIPEELKAREWWVGVRFERKPSGKLNKIPISENGREINAHDPQKWLTFETVLKRYNLDLYDGIAVVLSDHDPYTVIDDDTAWNDDESDLEPAARAIVSRFPNAYVERSTSGLGIHAVIQGSRPPGTKCRGVMPDGRSIEAYDKKRVMVLTGNRIDGYGCKPGEPIGEHQAELEKFCREFLPDDLSGLTVDIESAELPDVPEADELTIDGLKDEGSDRFKILWSGKWQDVKNDDGKQQYPSPSEADAALFASLQHYVRNVDRAIRIFLKSGLARTLDRKGKPNNQQKYLVRTSRKALRFVIAKQLEAESEDGNAAKARQGIGGFVGGKLEAVDVVDPLFVAKLKIDALAKNAKLEPQERMAEKDVNEMVDAKVAKDAVTRDDQGKRKLHDRKRVIKGLDLPGFERLVQIGVGEAARYVIEYTDADKKLQKIKLGSGKDLSSSTELARRITLVTGAAARPTFPKKGAAWITFRDSLIAMIDEVKYAATDEDELRSELLMFANVACKGRKKDQSDEQALAIFRSALVEQARHPIDWRGAAFRHPGTQSLAFQISTLKAWLGRQGRNDLKAIVSHTLAEWGFRFKVAEHYLDEDGNRKKIELCVSPSMWQVREQKEHPQARDTSILSTTGEAPPEYSLAENREAGAAVDPFSGWDTDDDRVY